MTLERLLSELRRSPIVASVQASEGSPVNDPATLVKLAQASLSEGVRVLRLEGVENIRAVKAAASAPVIGLIKRSYPGSPVYITPTLIEVAELIESGVEVVALDGTKRSRPGATSLARLISAVHQAGRLAMADCDSLDSAHHALEFGADLIGTTLSGYTEGTASGSGPDLELVRAAVQLSIPVLAEGRYSEAWQVQAALRIGAAGVVVGGAINDPVKQTRRFIAAASRFEGSVGAIDIGGTWLRFAVFSPDWKPQGVERVKLPTDREARLGWIRERVAANGVGRLGISTGGVVDPATGEVWDAKRTIPGHIGSVFSEETLGVPTVALNDGLATAWGHASLPQFAGKRVATLALGTGVGGGFVSEGRIWMGAKGEYPRVNDLLTADGPTIEKVLGGAALSSEPSTDQKARATKAFLQAALVLQEMYFPDEIVVCGSVGLSDWLRPWLGSPGLSASPFGADAGLYGAAALVLFASR